MYEAYITTLKNVRKHSNADKLQVGECFGNQVIIDLSYKEGDIGIYFPTDGKIGQEFAEANNLLRKKDENGNNIGGYLDPDKRNIKAIKLRGEKSDGLFMPLYSLTPFCNINELKVGDRITTLNGNLICEKYIPRTNKRKVNNNGNKQIKKKKEIEFPLFAEHIDTPQFQYNLDMFHNGDEIIITEKLHGTSARIGYMIKEKANSGLIGKMLNKYLKPKYEYVSGSRRVVLNSFDGGFYGDNKFREQWHDFFKGKLQKGEEIFGEIVGFISPNLPIMPDGNNEKIGDKEFIKKYGKKTQFSYGCNREKGTNDFYIYRMTKTDEDGNVFEYPYDYMKVRAEQMGAKVVPLLDKFYFTNIEDLQEKVKKHVKGSSTIDISHIREGVVIRINNYNKCNFTKEKQFEFKVIEGIIKDEAKEPDIEELQEIEGE